MTWALREIDRKLQLEICIYITENKQESLKYNVINNIISFLEFIYFLIIGVKRLKTNIFHTDTHISLIYLVIYHLFVLIEYSIIWQGNHIQTLMEFSSQKLLNIVLPYHDK